MKLGSIVFCLCLVGAMLPVHAGVFQAYSIDPVVTSDRVMDLDSNGVAEKYTLLNLPDSPLAGHPGEPLIPHRPVTLLLPPGETLDAIRVETGEWTRLPGQYTLAPAQPDYPLSMPDSVQPVLPDPVIYSSAAPFPAVNHSSPKIFWCKGYQIVTLNLFPVKYIPAENTILKTDRITVTLTTRPLENTDDHARCRGIAGDREWVQSKVDNPGLATAYREEAAVRPSKINDRDTYEYVIITTGALAGAGGPNNYQDFLAFKSLRGISGTIKTVEEIYSEYSGIDNQTKIRNFILDAYENWDTEWILLGADHDGVPARGCYATAEGHEDSTIPTDMYYGCLDGSWDYSGNGIYGEMGDGPSGGDPDIFAEVFVGRCSAGNTTELNNVVAKTITYETDNYQQEWADNALMLGEYLWTATYGGDYMDELWYGSDAYGYTTPPYPPEWEIDHLYERESGWGSSDLVPKLNSNDLFWVNHLGHANESSVMHLYTSDVDGLTNSRPFLIYSQGCYAGAFDTTDCIAEHFSWTAHGAFAVIMNGRYGWGEIGNTDGPSQYFHRQFHDAYFTEDIREIGKMNQDSKEDNVWCLDYKANRWVCYELNLLGCPQTPINGRITTRGAFEFDAGAYGDGGTVTAIVRDTDLNTDPGTVQTVDVTITIADESDSETVTLTETGPNTCVFQGSIQLVAGVYAPGNGQLEALEGDTLLGTYIDAEDGFGGTNVPVTGTATADFTGPEISNVRVEMLDDTSAVIAWDTNEPCTSNVQFGPGVPPDQQVAVDELVTAHAVLITGLDQCLDYSYMVISTDDAGYTVQDDNSGVYYSFTTKVRVYVLNENMDSDPGWSVEGDWAWGDPTGGPSGPGHDPSSGMDGANVYGTNLSGAYAGGSAYHLTTPALDCSASVGTELSFYRWLAIDEYGADQCSVSVSNDGAAWHLLYENPNSNFYEYRWTKVVYDISAWADGEPEVYIRWTMGPAGTGSVGGWNIDNVEVSHAAPCNVPILIHHTHIIDDSAGNSDGMINPDEPIAMPVTLRNVGLDATNVTATLGTTYPHVSITSPFVSFGTINQGGYGESFSDFEFTAAAAAVDGDTIPFTLNWISDESSGTTAFNEEIVAANLGFDMVLVLDSGGDGDGILDPGETADLLVMIKNTGRLTATNITGTLNVDSPQYVTIDTASASFPNLAPGESGSVLDPAFRVTTDVTTPDHFTVQFQLNLTADSHSRQVTFDVEITTSTFARRYTWPMDDDPGWSTESQWAWGEPQGMDGDPSAGFTGSNVYGYNLAGDYTNDMTETNLTSLPVNCANFSSVEIRFMRWLGVESASYDHATFQVSPDNAVWTTIWDHNGESFTDPDWQAMTYDISGVADGEPTVYLRWVMGTTDTSVTYCGWNIDDVEIWAEANELKPVLSHTSHLIDDSAGNSDGNINPSEMISMDVTAENFGVAGSGITAYLSTDHPAITLLTDTAIFPDIPAYGSGTTLTPFEYQVGANAADGETIEFTVTYFSNEGNGSFTFLEEIYGPMITCTAVTVMDPFPGGDGDGILDPGETVQLHLTLTNTGRQDMTGVTGLITTDSPAYLFIDDGDCDFQDVLMGGQGVTLAPYFTVNAAAFTPDPTTVTFTLSLTGNPCTTEDTFILEITESTFTCRHQWLMDSDPGWTAEGQWEFGIPLGNDSDPSSGYTGDQVFGYNLAGDYTNSMPETNLTAGPIDCSDLIDVEVRFMRWLGVESSSYDHASFRVSNNGTAWTTLYDHTSGSFTDPDWQTMTYDISTVADGEPTVYLRWVMGSTDGTVTYCGWNIDDVEIWASSTGPVCLHHGDVNFDGEITAGDAQLTFQIALGIYIPTTEEFCAADCNGDGGVTSGDAQGVFIAAIHGDSCADPLPGKSTAGTRRTLMENTGADTVHHTVNNDTIWIETMRSDDDLILAEIMIANGDTPVDAFTCTISYNPDTLRYLDCRPGNLEPDWIDFGCRADGSGGIILGGFTAGDFTDNTAIIRDSYGSIGLLGFQVISGDFTNDDVRIEFLRDDLEGFKRVH